MAGETNLSKSLTNMTPTLNKGVYVFSSINDANSIPRKDMICEFKEPEGVTLILE